MKKVVLIEDRVKRKQRYIYNKNIKLESYSTIIKLCEKKCFKDLKYQIRSDSYDWFEDFDVIIAHESAWSDTEIEKLIEYCFENNKPLVLFSGGNTQSYFSEKPCSLLTIDVNNLYSSNLLIFLDHIKKHDKIELSRLQYGDKWKLNVLLNSRNNIAVFLKKNKNIDQIVPTKIEGKLPLSFKSIQEEYGYDMEWYEDGIEENAQIKLKEVMQEVNFSIKEELAKI